MAAPAIDDRSVNVAIAYLKVHETVRRKQVGAKAEQVEAGQEPPPVGNEFNTVEVWALDAKDDGHAWAARREAESDQTIAAAQRWKQQVDADEREATEYAKQRANTDLDQVKKELFDTFDQYEQALKKEVDNGQEWAKPKLAQWQAESKHAKKTIDEKLGPTLDKIDQRKAGHRRKTKLIAEQMAKRGQKARAWKTANSGQPENWPANQRAEVKQALENIATWADDNTAQIKPYGAKATVHLQLLAQVKQWTQTQAQQVDASAADPAKAAPAKQAALDGLKQAHESHARLEEFLAKREEEATEAQRVVDTWTQRNNVLAKQWLNSSNPKHRQWAQAWMESRQG